MGLYAFNHYRYANQRQSKSNNFWSQRAFTTRSFEVKMGFICSPHRVQVDALYADALAQQPMLAYYAPLAV